MSDDPESYVRISTENAKKFLDSFSYSALYLQLMVNSIKNMNKAWKNKPSDRKYIFFGPEEKVSFDEYITKAYSEYINLEYEYVYQSLWYQNSCQATYQTSFISKFMTLVKCNPEYILLCHSDAMFYASLSNDLNDISGYMKNMIEWKEKLPKFSEACKNPGTMTLSDYDGLFVEAL